MVMRFIPVHSEGQHDFREKGWRIPMGEVLRGGELQPVCSGSQHFRAQLLHASVGIGLRGGNLRPRAIAQSMQAYRDSLGRLPCCGIEKVRGYVGSCHLLIIPSSLWIAISRSCCCTTYSSSAAVWEIRT